MNKHVHSAFQARHEKTFRLRAVGILDRPYVEKDGSHHGLGIGWLHCCVPPLPVCSKMASLAFQFRRGSDVILGFQFFQRKLHITPGFGVIVA